MIVKIKKEVNKEKKQITIILWLMLIVLLTGLGLIGKIIISNSNQNNNEQQIGTVNTLYVEEQVKRWGGKYIDSWIRRKRRKSK